MKRTATSYNRRMARTIDDVLADALELSREDRQILADCLLDSVATDEERARYAEWDRRSAEIENGTAKLIPANDVIRELRAKSIAHDRHSR